MGLVGRTILATGPTSQAPKPPSSPQLPPPTRTPASAASAKLVLASTRAEANRDTGGCGGLPIALIVTGATGTRPEQRGETSSGGAFSRTPIGRGGDGVLGRGSGWSRYRHGGSGTKGKKGSAVRQRERSGIGMRGEGGELTTVSRGKEERNGSRERWMHNGGVGAMAGARDNDRNQTGRRRREVGGSHARTGAAVESNHNRACTIGCRHALTQKRVAKGNHQGCWARHPRPHSPLPHSNKERIVHQRTVNQTPSPPPPTSSGAQTAVGRAAWWREGERVGQREGRRGVGGPSGRARRGKGETREMRAGGRARNAPRRRGGEAGHEVVGAGGGIGACEMHKKAAASGSRGPPPAPRPRRLAEGRSRQAGAAGATSGQAGGKAASQAGGRGAPPRPTSHIKTAAAARLGSRTPRGTGGLGWQRRNGNSPTAAAGGGARGDDHRRYDGAPRSEHKVAAAATASFPPHPPQNGVRHPNPPPRATAGHIVPSRHDGERKARGTTPWTPTAGAGAAAAAALPPSTEGGGGKAGEGGGGR